jgi:hypothetical protein
MTRRVFSSAAHEWLAGYFGSIDSTALLMAFEAGAEKGQRARANDETTKDWGIQYEVYTPTPQRSEDAAREWVAAHPEYHLVCRTAAGSWVAQR